MLDNDINNISIGIKSDLLLLSRSLPRVLRGKYVIKFLELWAESAQYRC